MSMFFIISANTVLTVLGIVYLAGLLLQKKAEEIDRNNL